MATIRGYMACSVDGYIADPDGGFEWLRPFEQFDYGYDRFIAEIGTVVTGRKTYDQVRELFGWPYEGKKTVLLTHRPVEDPPPDTEVWAGDVAPLIPRLRKATGGDVWILGGADVQRAFLDAGGLDRVEVFLIPLLLGDGIPIWPRSDYRDRLHLNTVEALPGDMVRLDYRIGERMSDPAAP